jgi:hypothetical protein
MDNLIREDDTAVSGDKGNASDAEKRAAEDPGMLWAVKEKARPGRALTKCQRVRNRRFGKVRAKVKHIFRVLKTQFGYRKVAIAASPRTARWVSRSSSSRICLSPASALRLHQGNWTENTPSDAPIREFFRLAPGVMFSSSLNSSSP